MGQQYNVKFVNMYYNYVIYPYYYTKRMLMSPHKYVLF